MARVSRHDVIGRYARVNARDRIGDGPWQNVKGAVVEKSVADLHGGGNNLNKQTALTEKGETVAGRFDSPNTHDVLMKSWNSSHPSRGCSQAKLAASGGWGRLYCFAVN